jgi:hypothetical protein
VNRPIVIVGFVTCCLALAAITLHTPARADHAIIVVRSLDDALNAHDSAAVLVLLADGATVQDDRQPQSRQQIQGWVAELVRQEVRLDLIDEPEVSYQPAPPDVTLVTWQARLDLHMYRALGLRFVPATLHASVARDAITFLSIRPDPNWDTVLDWSALN